MMRQWLSTGLMAGMVFSSVAMAGVTPLEDLASAFPGAQVYRDQGRISRIYGAPLSTGASVEESVTAFIEDHADVFSDVQPGELYRTLTPDGFDQQPVMWQRDTGGFKFTAVYFGQQRDGIPVHNSNLTLLVRNEPGFPVVLAVSKLLDLGGFVVPVRMRNVNDQTLTIYLDTAGREVGAPVLARRYVVERGRVTDPDYDKYLVIEDARTGLELARETMIHNVDISGNIQAWFTPGLDPDTSSNPEVLGPLDGGRAEVVGGNFTFADVNGDFVISHGGNTAVTVRARLRGQWANVINNAGSNLQVDQIITPPGPADFELNSSKSELDTGQINGFLHTTLIHDWVVAINPTYPGMNSSFLVNVNLAQTCNAFFNGSSINFFRSGGGCVNTAYSTVVYHEYGHKLIADAGTGQGAYGEGMSDAISQVITDDPIVGAGFFGPGSMIRSGINNRNFPCSGEIHFCGQVLSGCVWDTRVALKVTEPVEFLAIIGDLTLNSILLRPSGIDPGITVDFLTLDDDDGNIGNGTPHYNEINEGFTAHNMPAPPLQLLDFDYPNGRPDLADPDGGTTFRVVVSKINGEPKPGTGRLHYNDGSGWRDIPMVVISSNVYDAVFPAFNCGDAVDYFVSAETLDGKVATDPSGAPGAGTFSLIAATDLIVAFEDNFETDKGWTVVNENLQTGAWVRVVPTGGGGRGDPPSDFDGSGRAFVTGNGFQEDVDGGPTRLISPTFDLSAGGDAIISYARWFFNDDNDDVLDIEISNDDGGTWTLVKRVRHEGQWVPDSFTVTDFITQTATMRLRFSTADNPNNSVTEAGLDAVRIVTPICGPRMLLEVDPLFAGQNATMRVTEATPQQTVFFIYSIKGTGSTPVPQLGVILGLDSPILAGSAVAGNNGSAQLTKLVPDGTSGRNVWIQAAEQGRISNVVATTIN